MKGFKGGFRSPEEAGAEAGRRLGRGIRERISLGGGRDGCWGEGSPTSPSRVSLGTHTCPLFSHAPFRGWELGELYLCDVGDASVARSFGTPVRPDCRYK